MEDKFQRESLNRLITLETKFDSFDHLGFQKELKSISDRQIKNEQQLKEIFAKVEKIEESSHWLWRTVVGSLLLGALTILFGI